MRLRRSRRLRRKTRARAAKLRRISGEGFGGECVNSPVFELFATLGLDSSGFDKGLQGSSDKASSFGSKIGGALSTAAKVGGAAIATASTAVVKLGKDAVEGYADFEQLAGGIETLFGTAGKGIEEYAQEQGLSIEKAVDGYQKLLDVQDTVMANASNAFKTAGLSANEYMDQVIQSAAAMISSVDGDTAKAAQLMDMSVIDMADNVNKMGTSMESVQNAYRGFSKGNFTMLDNLALGYGGTKEEMGRLLEDAEKLAGLDMFTFNINSYSDIVEAIHIVQENMGITGTTAKEASETISGSVASMKSAWQNLLVGMADPTADLGELIGNVVSTAETAFGNILPVAEQALTGIASFVEQIAPVIAEKLPGVVETVLPSVLNAATSLVTALVDALPTIMEVLIEQGPVIINTLLAKILEMSPEVVALGLTLLTSLAMGIADNLDELVPTIIDVVLEIVDVLTDPETLGNLVDAAIAIIVALAEGIINALPDLAERVPEIIVNIVDTLIENLPKLLKASIRIIGKLAQGLIENLPLMFNAAGQIVAEIVSGIGAAISSLWTAGKEAIDEVFGGFTSLDPWDWGSDLISNFVGGLKSKWEDLKSSVSGVAQTVKNLLGFSEPKEGPLSDFHTYAPDMMRLFAEGIRDNEHLITDQIADSFDFGDAVVGGSVGNGGAAGAAGIGASGLAEAIKAALNGAGVYMDGRKVGSLVTEYQASRARVMGV